MELDDYLYDIAADLRYDIGVRREARRLLERWRSGIVPGLREVAQLRKMVPETEVCARLQRDASCAWLRKNAGKMGLRDLNPGERVVCNRRPTGTAAATFGECPGYMKSRGVAED